MGSLAELDERRARGCRLTPDRALETLEEAEEFLRDRGMLTLTPACSLPSLFGACHEEPYNEHGRGFAGWPKTKWWWGGALEERPGVYFTKLLRGRGLFLSEETAAIADPLCRAELARTLDGAYGEEGARLAEHLAEAGPSLIEDVKTELGLEPKELRLLRTVLGRVGAIVGRGERIELAEGGHRHSSRLYRWDQLLTEPTGRGGLDDLVVAAVRAAVLAPERELRSWFTWKASAEQIEEVVRQGRLERPEPGVLATP